MLNATGAGITRNRRGVSEMSWSILAQEHQMIALEASSFAFEVVCEPNQELPLHAHSEQDKFLLVQFGQLLVTLDDTSCEVLAGDLIRIPRSVPHAYANRSSGSAKLVCWVSPAQDLPALFAAIDGVTDPDEIARVSHRYGVTLFPDHPASDTKMDHSLRREA